MAKIGSVYVVCAMDTEGPIQDRRKPDILDSWERVDTLIQDLISREFRFTYPDSNGKGLVYSWFILTLSGFKTNPFNRPMGYNIVFDHYMNTHGANFKQYGDGIYWHYHQPAPSGIGNEWCKDWTHTTEYLNVLSHLVIDRHFFPSCFRAGGRIEDNDLSHWLEDWIPYDYSNANGNVNWDRVESDGKKLKEICDWQKATTSWLPYHPSEADYQLPGNMKRWVFRCPDLASPVHTLSKSDVEQAFEEASNGKDVILSFFEHDRRMEVKKKIKENACQLIFDVAKNYPKVKWSYENARDAAAKVTNASEIKAPQFTIETRENDRIMIRSSDDIFGKTPFVCAVVGEAYQTVPVEKIGKNKWISGQLPLEQIKKIGIAANADNGRVGVSVYQLDKKSSTIQHMESAFV